MKLYYYPVSTTSRALMLFAAESGLDIDFQVVDLFTGEQLQPAYAAINPNCLVPMLEDGDFRRRRALRYSNISPTRPALPRILRTRASGLGSTR